jgi:GDPmannose 4,6-dehydratase
LITGVTGQDGAYLAEFLLGKGYEVHGVKRRTSLFNTDRIDHLYQDPHEKGRRFILHHGDMTDTSSLTRVIQQVLPGEIYNVAAQSHGAVSFEEPEYTANSDALGELRLLEAIRILGRDKRRASTRPRPRALWLVRVAAEGDHPLLPAQPLCRAKLTPIDHVNYREAYGMYACNGILFNKSPVRGETLRHPQDPRALASSLGPRTRFPGPQRRRDWGTGRLRRGDAADAAAEGGQDFVIATGESITACPRFGAAREWPEDSWRAGREGKGYDAGRCIVAVDPRYFRPTEVESPSAMRARRRQLGRGRRSASASRGRG